MFHPEIIYIIAHNRKLGGLFTTLELLAFARNGSVITSCFVCSESLESFPPSVVYGPIRQEHVFKSCERSEMFTLIASQRVSGPQFH